MPEEIIPSDNNLEERLKTRAEQHWKIKEALDSLPKCPFFEMATKYKEFHRYYSGYYPFRSSDY